MNAKTRTTRAKRAAAPEARNAPPVIRKYPNRRLYDTVESRYVTLADVRRLVVERIDFVVLDRKTQQDITRSILLQVIAEQEGAGESLMSHPLFGGRIMRTAHGLHPAMRPMHASNAQEIIEIAAQHGLGRGAAPRDGKLPCGLASCRRRTRGGGTCILRMTELG